MKLEYFHYELNLRSPFRLATGSRRHTDIIIVKLFYDSWVGYGEACLPPYLGEDAHSVIAFLNKIDPIRLKMDVPIYETLEYIDGIREGNNAAKAALDIALHDLLGKIKNKSIHELYGLEKPNNVFTSLTIGMGSLKELEQKLKIKLDVKMYKFKLGGENDKKLIEDYLSISNKPFCVDVNQGWSNKEFALEMITWLHEKGAVFVEQPIKSDNWKEMEWIFERSPLPLIADESVKRLADIDKAIGHFDGINIKLMKSTGIYEAIKMINRARELGLKVLLGCMAESSCAISAAWHLIKLADWVDLDAPLLSLNDPFEGVYYQNSSIKVKGNIGLGVELKDNLF